ncbi:hypothetical protein Tco_1213709 [Tanacetum coccineum]
MKCVSSILSTTGKEYGYKYGGQRSYKRITTHVYLVISFTQISVDTLGPQSGRTGGQMVEEVEGLEEPRAEADSTEVKDKLVSANMPKREAVIEVLLES